MAHELSLVNGQYGYAQVAGSEKPWHGLGQEVDPTADAQTWRKAAGLDWEARRSVVSYFNDTQGKMSMDKTKHVLYRSDTGNPLSVVSSDYNIVQPEAVVGFFGDLAKTGGFSIETVGSLKQGRKIWALGRVGENAKILDDEVAPYLLLATSYDGTMATTAKFTTVRVVCNNTLQASLKNSAGRTQVSIPHSIAFDPVKVKADLGIATDSWSLFKLKAERMASHKISDFTADAWVQDLLAPYSGGMSDEQLRKTRGYRRIMDLFHGGQMGTGQEAIDGTMWGLLQATTQYVDHEKGRTADGRIDAAWFGPGAKFKERAFELAELVRA